MFASFQLICRRADNGEVVWKSTDLPDYAAFDLVGLPLLADGKLFIAAKSQAESAAASRASRSSSSWRSSPTTARCSGRPRSARSARASSTSTTTCRDTSPQPRLVYRAGAIYRRHARRRARPARRRFRGARLGIRLQDGPVPVGVSLLLLLPAPGADGRAAARRCRPARRSSIKGMQSERLYAVEPEPDEGPLGAADHQGLAPARRRRPRRVSGRRRAERGRPEDAEALVGDARAQRQHGRPRPGAARRPLATDARAASTRSIPSRATCGGSSAARTWARWAATCCSPTGGCWLSPIARSPPIPRRGAGSRSLRPRRLRDPRRRRLAMNKPAIAAICLSLVARRRGPPGPGPVLRPDGSGAVRLAEYRGLHRRRQGLSSRPSPTWSRSTWTSSPPPS